MSTKAQPVWQLDCLLGEGPIWLPDEQRLRFVDIKRGRLHRFDPATGTGTSVQTDGAPSFIVAATDGRLLAGSRSALHWVEEDGLGAVLAEILQPATNRTNDGTVDSSGRLWFGTMDDNEAQASGEVWCLDAQGLHRAGPHAVVTNGPAISADGRWLYHVDSGERTIWRYPLTDKPTLADGEAFLHLSEDEGYPDGIIVDSENCLWVALWDGWGVRRYAPDGSMLLHVPLPCARVTKVALGGPDLKTAYVTTARVGLDEGQLAEQPLAGSLFAFDAPAAGVKPNIVSVL